MRWLQTLVLAHLMLLMLLLFCLTHVEAGTEQDDMENGILHKLADSSDDIGFLKRIVSGLQHLSQSKKRTCLLNLGGHCSTENAALLADRWYYLNSPMSPGRKRTGPRRYRKFAPNKISNRNKLESR